MVETVKHDKTVYKLNSKPLHIAATLLSVLLALIITSCSIVKNQNGAIYSDHRNIDDGEQNTLSPAQNYAGEVLSYLLQVVVGYAGPEGKRQVWRTKGSGHNLVFYEISKKMSDPEYRKTDLIVMDADLLGLSDVLYQYEPLFNQFKGRYVVDSVYPSSELIAIRLLILEKLNQGKQVSFSAIRSRESLFQANAALPSPADLTAMNLSVDEFQLIKDVFLSEPLYLAYYKHPFIVEALTRIGFFAPDKMTKASRERVSSGRYARCQAFDAAGSRQVNIAILPSLIHEFQFDNMYQSPYNLGFRPTEAYLNAVYTLKTEIVSRTANRVRYELLNTSAGRKLNEETWQHLWTHRYLPNIRFQLLDTKPFSIYPENAEWILKDLCPQADLSVIVLGKNVYRTMNFKAGDDSIPVSGRIYLDIEDIGLAMVGEQVDGIADFIAKRLLQVPVAAGGEAAAFSNSP